VDDVFTMPEGLPLRLDLFCQLYRESKADRPHRRAGRIRQENVSALREHLRIPGMGLTTVRYFRDKLAMRARAKEAGMVVPEFVPRSKPRQSSKSLMTRVPGAVAAQAALAGVRHRMKKIHAPEELWALARSVGRSAVIFICWSNLFQARYITWKRRVGTRRVYSRQRMPMARHRFWITSHNSAFPPQPHSHMQALCSDINRNLLAGLVRARRDGTRSF